MEKTVNRNTITVNAIVQATVDKVWKQWTNPEHIMQWYNASEDWHTPAAENDLRAGGRFTFRMEAKDGSMGFDFTGVYTEVEEHALLAYKLDDGRKVQVTFTQDGNETHVTETFEADQTHSAEMQQAGWQAILDHFKKHVESPSKTVTLHYEISIKASSEKVYSTMLDETQYKVWTAAFHPTSHFKGDWEKGSKIRFLGVEEDGSVAGMISLIRENIPNKYVSIEHIGLIHGSTEITRGPEVESWAGALENYTFTEQDGKTLVSISVDSNKEFEAHFSETWPKALMKLKALCEAGS